MVVDGAGDIELQRGGHADDGKRRSVWLAGGRRMSGIDGGGVAAGVKGGMGGVKGRFKRLGSDAGLGFMHIGNLVRKDHEREVDDIHMGDRGVAHMDSTEAMFQKPERVHVRERRDEEIMKADGIRVKQEFDIYYDRPPL